MRFWHLLLGLVGVVGVQGTPVLNPVVGSSASDNYNNPFSIESMLKRNRMKGGDLDRQTQNDLRILSFFEEELNKIFSCYIRLSCPRTRSPEVISECSEIRDWPLYHQVMRMAGIKRYPYSNYAPVVSTTTTTVLPPISPTEVTDNGLSADEEAENEIHTQVHFTTSAPLQSRSRGGRNRVRRRNHADFME